MIGIFLHILLWLLLTPVFLFLLVNGGLRLAAQTGDGILLTRNGLPYIVKLNHWLPQLIGHLRALLTGHGYSADHWAEAEATRFAAVHASEFQHLYAFPVPPLVPA